MANELTFKIIDIEDAIVDFKNGHISEEQLLGDIQDILDGSELATITFDEPTSVFGANGGSTGDVVEPTYNITKL